MEKEIKIGTSDKKVIYGTFSTPNAKVKTIVIFVHGLTSFRNEHQFFNGSKFLNKKGIATFRFDLYSYPKKARKLHECTVALHGKDTTRVIGYFRKKGFTKIFLVGHSLGCPSILFADTASVQGIVFWDPSIDPRKWVNTKKGWAKDFVSRNKRADMYLMHVGADTVLGKEMHQEWKQFPNCRKLVEQIHAPIKFICAEKGILVKGGKEYYKHANKPKAFAIIPGARHNFDEKGTEERLFEETWKWIKRF